MSVYFLTSQVIYKPGSCLLFAFILLQAPVSTRDVAMAGGTQARTFHLHEVELVNGLQQRAVVQAQVEVCGHPGSERAFPPLILSQVHSPYEGIRNLITAESTA